MFLDHLSIRTKALIPVVVMALTVLTVLIVTGAQTSSFTAAANDMIGRQDRGLVAILTAAREVNRLKLTVFQSLIYDGSDIGQNDKEKKTFDDARTRTNDLLAEAARLLPSHAPQISQFAKQFDEIVESAKSPLDIGLNGSGVANGRDTKPEDLDKLAEGARALYHVDNASTALVNDMSAIINDLIAENEIDGEGPSGEGAFRARFAGDGRVRSDSDGGPLVDLDHLPEDRPAAVAACRPNRATWPVGTSESRSRTAAGATKSGEWPRPCRSSRTRRLKLSG